VTKKLIISESERNKILSMYGLLNEATKGTVTIKVVTELEGEMKTFDTKVILKNISTDNTFEEYTKPGTGEVTFKDLVFATYSLTTSSNLAKTDEKVFTLSSDNPNLNITLKTKPKEMGEIKVVGKKIPDSLVVQEIPSSDTKNKYVPVPDVLVTVSQIIDEIEISEIEREYTDDMGNFEFDNLPTDVPLILNIYGGNIYNDFEKSFEPLGDKTIKQFAPFVLTPKKQEVSKLTPQKVETPCEGYKSDEDTFYGRGYAINKQISDLNITTETESVKLAKRDAVKQYLIMYPNDYVKTDEIVKEKMSWDIVCNFTTSDLVTPKTTTVAKIDKDILDKIVQKIISDKSTKRVKLEFENLKFKDAITLSKTINQPIFLLIGSVDDDATKEIISYIEKNQEMTNKINKNYVTLYYEVDENETDKYMTAVGALDIDTYPALITLKGIGDPNKEIRKSFEVINKEQRIGEDLPLIDTLI
jgi:hypothetical protein